MSEVWMGPVLLEFTVPTIEYKLLAPVLLVLLAACLGILAEAALPRHYRFAAQLGLAFGSLLVALGFAVANWRKGGVGVLAMGSITLDGPTHATWVLLLAFGLLSICLFAERKLNGGTSAFCASGASVPGSQSEREASAARFEHTEVFPLALFAIGGMMIFASANDLITMFVALEVFSLPLYLLCGLARRRRLLSQEAALKYFLLGALSSAFFLFGIALLYGYSGSFDLAAVDSAMLTPVYGRGLLIAGIALLAIGFLFKVGAVPFHTWTPDVYVGAPTAVTGFMAIATKAAAMIALARVFFVALGGARWDWQPLLAIIAVITMGVGGVIAITQNDVKRMLAYSSITHAGFMLTALAGANAIGNGQVPGQLGSVASILFYLAGYGFATLGSFAILTMVRNAAGGEATGLGAWAGLGRRNPFLAATFSVFLLSFAGIPLTAGFLGKWVVFAAAWRGGYWWLVPIGIVMSLIAAAFYLRVILVMFFTEPSEDSEVGDASWLTWVPIIVGLAGTLALGIVPGTVMELLAKAGEFLR